MTTAPEPAPQSGWRERLRAFLRTGAVAEPAALLAGLVAVCAVSAAFRASLDAPGYDYYQWWSAGQAVRRGIVADVYAPASRRKIIEAYYGSAAAEAEPDSRYRASAGRRADLHLPRVTPFAIALAGFTNTGSYDADLVRYHIVCYALYVLAIVAMARRLGYSAAPALLLVAALTFWFDPFTSDSRVANTSRLQFGVMAWYVALVPDAFRRGRHVAAGAALGVAAMLKPNVLFVVLAVALSRAIQRRWPEFRAEAAGALAGVAGSLLFSIAWFGTPGCWTSWARHFPEYTHDLVEFGNFSLAALLHQKAGWSVGWPMIAAGFAGAAIYFYREPAGTEADRGPQAARRVGVGAAIMLLAAPLAWIHYFMFIIPLILHALRPRPGETTGRFLAGASAGLAAIVMIGRTPLTGVFQVDALPAAVLACTAVAGLVAAATAESLVPPRAPA